MYASNMYYILETNRCLQALNCTQTNPNLRTLIPKPNYYNVADLDHPTKNAMQAYTELNLATGLTMGEFSRAETYYANFDI